MERYDLSRAPYEPVDGEDEAGAAPTPSLSESFNCLPGLNLADRLADISIDSPGFGLRPGRACRSDTENVPKPEMFTRSPWRSAAMMSSSTMLIARSASALLRGSLLDNASISSALVICALQRRRIATAHLSRALPVLAGSSRFSPAQCYDKFVDTVPSSSSPGGTIGTFGSGSRRNARSLSSFTVLKNVSGLVSTSACLSTSSM